MIKKPILNQKHGGILAILTKKRSNGIIEFLLFARKEPGDKSIKLCPSFSATQSNINLAHGGKKTDLSNIILNVKKKILSTYLCDDNVNQYFNEKVSIYSHFEWFNYYG